MSSITNQYAKEMITSIVKKSPKQNEAMNTFFKYANDNKIQGPALISYYTELNKAGYGNKQNIIDTIDLAAKKDKSLHLQAKKFVTSLGKNYPKTLLTRISLADNGSVVDGKVMKTSIFKKFMTRINQFVNEG